MTVCPALVMFLTYSTRLFHEAAYYGTQCRNKSGTENFCSYLGKWLKCKAEGLKIQEIVQVYILFFYYFYSRFLSRITRTLPPAMWTISSTSQTCRWACEAFHHCVYVWLGLITTRYNKSMSWSWVRRLKSPCDCHQCIHFTVQTLFASSCHWECCEYLYSPWMYLIIFCFFFYF